jgi:APA family basic amino acid/polyamine antiporter
MSITEDARLLDDNVRGRTGRPDLITRIVFAVKNLDYTQLYRRQPMKGIADQNLAKVLTVIDLVAYGVSSTVGAGIFVATGSATVIAGPAVVLSYLFAGIASFFSALCYGEFAARIPIAGSAYTFSYVALGEFVAWIIGWCLTLEYAISASATARSWSGSLVQALQGFHVKTPAWLDSYPVSFMSLSPMAAVIVLLCAAVLLIGARESSTFNVIMTVFNIGVILFVIVLGSIFVDTANWKPFTPFGFRPVFVGTGKVFFSYIGFDAVTTLAAEVKNPKRDMPIGVVGTLFIATSLYIAAVLVLTGMVPLSAINKEAPLAAAFHTVGASWAAHVVAIGSITTLTATTLTSLMGQPRIFYQMAQDGLLFKFMLKLSSNKIPYIATVVTAVLAAVLAAILNLDVLTDMISIGTLLAFTMVCGGIVVLRFTPEESASDSRVWGSDGYGIVWGRFPFLERIAKFTGRWLIPNIFLWALTSFVFAILYRNDVAMGYYFILLPFALVPLVALHTLRPQSIPNTFVCPFVPLVPLIGMFVNIFLLSQKEIPGVVYFCIWLAAGIIVYFAYGFWHSKLRTSPSATTATGKNTSLLSAADTLDHHDEPAITLDHPSDGSINSF